MRTIVAVADPTPAYRRGLSAALEESGFAPAEPEDPAAWLGERSHRAVMLTVASDDDARALQRLRHLRADAVLVALLRDPVPLSYRRVLRAGASAAACWDAVPAALVEVVRSALGGLCLLPIGVAHHLAHAAAGEAGDGRAPPLDEEQVGWLRCLADGSTVAGLAHSAGYSEREMYRLLSALYRSMGVRSRTEALVRATSMGLIDGCQQRARAAPPVAPHRPTAR